MEAIFSLLVIALLGAIVLGAYSVIEFFKAAGKELTSLQKKIVTAVVGAIFSLIWFLFVPDSRIDLIILTFLASVGFYDIVIKTIKEIFEKKSHE